MIAHPEVGAEDLVLRGEEAQLLVRFLLGLGVGGTQLPQPDVRRNDGIDERVERVVAERGQHRRLVLGRGPDVPVLKEIACDIHLTRACEIPRASEW